MCGCASSESTAVEVTLSSSGLSGMVAGCGAADWASWWPGDEEDESGEDCCVKTESAVSSARSVRRDGGLDRCDLVGAVMTTGGLQRMFAVKHSVNRACQIVLSLD